MVLNEQVYCAEALKNRKDETLYKDDLRHRSVAFKSYKIHKANAEYIKKTAGNFERWFDGNPGLKGLILK
jgi:hypothetical protein